LQSALWAIFAASAVASAPPQYFVEGAEFKGEESVNARLWTCRLQSVRNTDD
jgi:hypothetical protein